MPLPLIGSCEIPESACCEAMFTIARYILNRIYDGLVDCLARDCNGVLIPLARYVTMGYGDDGIADSLTVAITKVTITSGSRDSRGKDLPIANYRATYDARLRESGWPKVRLDGGQIDAPDPEVQQRMALHAYAHGEKMYRTLRQMVSQSAKTWVPDYPIPTFFSVGDLTPLNPQGGIVGWSTPVTLDMPWNTAGF